MSVPDSPRPRQSAGPAPLRRPGSVRRTSTIEAYWPDGFDGALRMRGRARDLLTPVDGSPPRVLEAAGYFATLGLDRTIETMEGEPPHPALAKLAGVRGGGGLRKALLDAVPDERERGSPLYLILDDLAGASLVAPWSNESWDPNWMERLKARLGDDAVERMMASRVDVCTGLAQGSSAFDPETERGGTDAPDLRHPDDAMGWHEFTDQHGRAGFRRARRIDVHIEADEIVVASAFQDSASTPSGVRSVVHEYELGARISRTSGLLTALTPVPRVLPHVECPGATAYVPRLLGTSVTELRESVLTELRGVFGCTHLNDALRALADVPVLIGPLLARSTAGPDARH